jgi:hypothetical protein
MPNNGARDYWLLNGHHIIAMWHLQNQEIKGASPEEAATIQKNNLIEEIVFTREQFNDIPIETQQLINKDRNDIAQLPVRTVAAYLYSVKLIIKAHRKYRHRHRRQTVLQHFRPAPDTQHPLPADRSELDPGEH